MSTICINKKKYLIAKDVIENDSNFFIGCKKRSRDTIAKFKLNIMRDYAYGKKVKDEWTLIKDQTKPANKSTLLFRYKWVTDNVPAYMKESVKKAKEDSGEKLYKYETAPDVLELDDNEKFKDNEGNVYEIEVRGNRNVDKCYFKASDIGEAFGIKVIHNTITQSNNYIIEKQFKKFIVHDTHVMGVRSNKNNNKEMLFFTYDGVLQCIYSSQSKQASQFRTWATETLFTLQMGSVEDKTELINKVLGTNAQVAKSVFNSRARKFSSVYLFSLGYVKDLKTSMDLKNMDDNDIVCKYGRTNDLSRRTGEHILKYNKINGVELKLMLYAFIEDEYGAEAEDEIKSFFNFADCKVTYENNDELVIIEPKKLKEVKLRYDALENEYSKGIEIFKKEIMQKNNEIIQLKNDKELIQLKSDKEILILKNNNELMQKDNELIQAKSNSEKEMHDLKIQLKEYELDKYKQKLLEVNTINKKIIVKNNKK